MPADITFKEAIRLFQSIYPRFEKIQGRPWGVEGAMIELSKQVGDLSKHVMVAEKYYPADRENQPEYATTLDDIGDELGDVMAQLVRIADYYKIDLVDAYLKGREGEDASLKAKGV